MGADKGAQQAQAIWNRMKGKKKKKKKSKKKMAIESLIESAIDENKKKSGEVLSAAQFAHLQANKLLSRGVKDLHATEQTLSNGHYSDVIHENDDDVLEGERIAKELRRSVKVRAFEDVSDHTKFNTGQDVLIEIQTQLEKE